MRRNDCFHNCWLTKMVYLREELSAGPVQRNLPAAGNSLSLHRILSRLIRETRAGRARTSHATRISWSSRRDVPFQGRGRHMVCSLPILIALAEDLPWSSEGFDFKRWI